LNDPLNAQAISDFLNNGWLLSVSADQVLVGWGEWVDAASSLQKTGCVLFAPDFRLQDPAAWRATSHWALVERNRFHSLLLNSCGGNVNARDQRFQWVEPDLGDFTKAWDEIREGFSERGLRKAVPVVFAGAEGEFSASERAHVLVKLLQAPATLHLYGFWQSDEWSDYGMIGATPENLFIKRGRELETMAVAGTKAKTSLSKAEASAEFLADPKERHEHQLVIDDLRETLGLVGEVRVGETQVLELPSLYHLMTPIRAVLKREMMLSELVALLHPTPALGLSPRRMGFSEMERWGELDRRGRFGAPFGVAYRDEQGIENLRCVVAIRNIQWQDQRIMLGSGCGVVPQSDFEREWAELRTKRESVKRLMDL
jgi:menaquinone-specific isochorismate synthase